MMLKTSGAYAGLQDVDCLIVDEVSMMSKDQLLRLDRLLRRAKRVKDVSFGGLHVLRVGDFLQLPPVGADPLYLDPSTKTKSSLFDFEGFRLWRSFTKVIVRSQSDFELIPNEVKGARGLMDSGFYEYDQRQVYWSWECNGRP
jgi:PIF1-like helicase